MNEAEKKQNRLWLHRAAILGLFDIIAIGISYFFALLLRFDFLYSKIPGEYLKGYVRSMPWILFVTVVVFYFFKLYHSIWRLISLAEFKKILEAYLALIPIYLVMGFLLHLSMPLSYYFMGYLLSFCFTVGIRFSYRLLRSWGNWGKELELAKEGKRRKSDDRGSRCGRSGADQGTAQFS